MFVVDEKEQPVQNIYLSATFFPYTIGADFVPYTFVESLEIR